MVARQLTLDELKGGSCTITNIGPLGGMFATPIINQPELAIIGLHAIKERPEEVDGEIAIRKMMYLSMSFDHRWIDGAEGASALRHRVLLHLAKARGREAADADAIARAAADLAAQVGAAIRHGSPSTLDGR